MPADSPQSILPMQTHGTQHFIERTYRESGDFQWVRETLTNALEAGATRVEFGIEWQAVESQGVYRRTIADNGRGMSSDQLVQFFNTFGSGGKPIGGAHENFGVGSKTSLLPWNAYGMVVVSWLDGVPSMIWVMKDPSSGEYGLKIQECQSATAMTVLESVYAPYFDPAHGCDWRLVKPSWLEDHGTVIVLMGTDSHADTVSGDPLRNESSIKGIAGYLNRRFWEIPQGVEVYVHELRSSHRAEWPTSRAIAEGTMQTDGADRRINRRKINGASFYIQYPVARFKKGKIAGSGTVPLNEGTQVGWFLWQGDRPQTQSFAASGGYIAVQYRNELYDISSHHSTYRQFGISESSVRSRLWLIIRPTVDAAGQSGVYPRTDRNSLLITSGQQAGSPLPISDWAGEFADNMPEELVEALREARQGEAGTITDDEWRERLAERFGCRWKIKRLCQTPNGQSPFDPVINGHSTEDDTSVNDRLSERPTCNTESHGLRKTVAEYGRIQRSGSQNGDSIRINGGIPSYRPVGADDVGPGVLAAWQPHDPVCPEGVVLINVDHPVLRSVIEHWQSRFALHHTEAIEDDVISVYGQVAVSKVAHSEHLKAILPAQTVEAELRSDAALTMSLLGLMCEDRLIAAKVGG